MDQFTHQASEYQFRLEQAEKALVSVSQDLDFLNSHMVPREALRFNKQLVYSMQQRMIDLIDKVAA